LNARDIEEPHVVADDLHVSGGRDRRRSGDLPLFSWNLAFIA
jgi:hypothetical protein